VTHQTSWLEVHQQVLSYWLQFVTANVTTAVELMKSLQLCESHLLNLECYMSNAQNKSAWKEASLHCIHLMPDACWLSPFSKYW